MSFNLSIVEMVAAPLLVYIQGFPTIIFSFKRREKTDTAITVNFAISGSAILGTHYTQSGSTTYNGNVGTLYFAPGETFKNVFIQPISGADFLTGESLVFALLEGTGYKPTTLNGTIVYILDKAGSVGPVFSIELNPQVIAEDDNITKFIFTFSKSGVHSSPLALNYEVTGTASSVGQPADYTGLSPGPIYTLTFQPNETSKTIEVTVVNDNLIEGDETVIVNLLQGVGYKRSFPIQAIGTITDDDFADETIQFYWPPVVDLEYAFKVLQPSSVEGFGADVDLDLTGYNLIGIINKGSLGYTAIFNLGTVYKFITDLSQFTVDTSSLSSPNFIYSWKGGESLGAAIYTAPTENTVKDLNGQAGGFPIIDAIAEVPMVRFSYWVKGSPYPPFLIEGLGSAGIVVNDYYWPLSPNSHTESYSGSATKITTYTPGGDKTITRAINRVVNYTPSNSTNINGSGDYTTTFDFDTINNKLYPKEYKLLKLDGTTQSFPGLSQYNHDVWSLNGTSNGSFTSIFGAEFNFSGQASYTATGSIDNGSNYIVYVNPYSLQELKYINYRLGNWNKTYTTVTTCSGDTFWETVINLAETYNFTSYLYNSELLIETDDTFIASVKYGELEFDYSLNYSGTESAVQSSGMEDLCFKAGIHLDYPGSNYNLNVNLIDGSGLVPFDAFRASSANFNFKEIYQLSIGDLEYLFSPDYKSFYSWVGSWALPISIVNSSIQVTDLGFTTGPINGITSISCINGQYTNNHTVSAYTPFTLIGQEVLVIYRNGTEYWECEGVISACDEVTIESTNSVIGGYDGQGDPFYYTFDGVYTLECDSLTIDLDLGTQVFNSFFAFSSILSYQPEYYCLVIDKNDFTKLLVELLKENNARSLLTMYKIENTVEIAIAQKPTDVIAQTEWRADIYRFNTTTLKWQRQPNGVSPLSALTALSDYISYYPLPTVAPFAAFEAFGAGDQPVFYVNEDGTPVTPVTLTRTGTSSGTVSVSLTPTSGTANSSEDFNGTPITVFFSPGETIKVVDVPIIEDVIIEGDEFFNLTLSNPTGGAAIGSPSTAILTIIDNDINLNGAIQFNSPTYSVYEDGTPVAPITLVRVGGSDGTVTVTVTPTDGTATALSDFDATDIIVEFLPGELSKVIAVPIVDDLLEEGNETVLLELGDVTGGAIIGEQSTATLTIIDNDIAVGGSYNFRVLQPGIIEGFNSSELLDINSSGSSTYPLTLTITFDNYPEETSWELRNTDDVIIQSGGPYPLEPDGSTLVINFTIPSGCYKFIMLDAYGDGIYGKYGNGVYTLEDEAGQILASGGSFTFSESTPFCLGVSSIYTRIGLLNLGNDYLAVLKKDGIPEYTFLDTANTFNLNLSTVYNINPWRGQKSLSGIMNLPSPLLIENVSDHAGQDYSSGPSTAVSIHVPFIEVPGAFHTTLRDDKFADAWSYGLSFGGYTPASYSPFTFNSQYLYSSIYHDYEPLRPNLYFDYSGTAEETQNYNNGGSRQTQRTFQQTSSINPAGGENITGSGSYNMTMNLVTTIDVTNRKDYTIKTPTSPAGLIYEGKSSFNQSNWSVTGTCIGGFTSSKAFDVWTIDISASDSYTASGSFNFGYDYCAYVNPITLVEKRNKEVSTGIWTKSFNGNIIDNSVFYDGSINYVLIDYQLNITENFSFVKTYQDFTLLWEFEDCYIAKLLERTIDYSFSINRAINEIGHTDVSYNSVNQSQYWIHTDYRYDRYDLNNEGYQIDLSLVKGRSIFNGASLQASPFIGNETPSTTYLIGVGLTEYSVSLETQDIYQFAYNVPTVNGALATFSSNLQVEMVGINSVSATNSRYKNGQTTYDIFTNYSILNQEVLVIVQNGNDYWECEGIITSANETITPYDYGADLLNLKRWQCSGFTVTLNLETMKTAGFCCFTAALFGQSYSIVVNKNNMSKLVFNLLNGLNSGLNSSSVNMYKVEETVELAIAQKPNETIAQDIWYADIYRFNTTTLKWERRPNGVSALSGLSATSQFISYHPTPAV